MSSVEQIINALSSLETDLDNLNSKVNDMKKRIIAYSATEIEKQKQKVIVIANEDAKGLIDAARKEAENESAIIMAEMEKITLTTKKNIDSSLPKAVEFVVKKILGQIDQTDNPRSRNTSS
jgi:flagellar biosynthesis/type III secretory pathway protein FliH